MEITTMKMNALACALSARPHTVGVVLLADTRIGVQGTAVSIAKPGIGLAVAAAPFGVAMADATSYRPTDVVRSRSGRPPV